MLAWAAAMPASAGEVDDPMYRISVSWQFGRTRAPRPRIDLSVFSSPDIGDARIMHVPLYQRPPSQEAMALSCPEQGCSKAFLTTLIVIGALGVWGTVEVIDDYL
jgi:hypothetical protein